MVKIFQKTIPDYEKRDWPPIYSGNRFEMIEGEHIVAAGSPPPTEQHAMAWAQSYSNLHKGHFRWRWIGPMGDIVACGSATPNKE